MMWIKDREALYGGLALNPSSEPELCFFCGRPTYLIDLNYQAPYCGRHEDEIAADLAGGRDDVD